MSQTIVTILAIIGLYTVLKKLGCLSFVFSLIIVVILFAWIFDYL